MTVPSGFGKQRPANATQIPDGQRFGGDVCDTAWLFVGKPTIPKTPAATSAEKRVFPLKTAAFQRNFECHFGMAWKLQ
jgi:hypothetical protein